MKNQTMMACVLLCVAPLCLQADEPQSPRDKIRLTHITMKMKLELSKRIIAGLTQEDYPSLTESAKAIQLLNNLEAFSKNEAPDYQTHRKVFNFSTRELVRSAEEKNLDGATLAFNQMT